MISTANQNKHEDCVQIITEESATQYRNQNIYSTKGIVHLASCSLDLGTYTETEEKYANIIRWERQNERVTHDILRLKPSTDQLFIEYSSLGESKMHKLVLQLSSVMGCEITAEKLTLDVPEPPLLQLKDVRGHCSRALLLRTLARATSINPRWRPKIHFFDTYFFSIFEIETTLKTLKIVKKGI